MSDGLALREPSNRSDGRMKSESPVLLQEKNSRGSRRTLSVSQNERESEGEQANKFFFSFVVVRNNKTAFLFGNLASRAGRGILAAFTRGFQFLFFGSCVGLVQPANYSLSFSLVFWMPTLAALRSSDDHTPSLSSNLACPIHQSHYCVASKISCLFVIAPKPNKDHIRPTFPPQTDWVTLYNAQSNGMGQSKSGKSIT
jgi:hypothetical protein